MVISRWKQRVVFLRLVSVTSLAAYHFGSLAPTALTQREQQAPILTINGLFVEPQILDLGEMWQTPTHRFLLAIHNRGSVPRSIERFQTTCGCLEFDPPGKTIAPGDKAEFVGTLDLTPHRQDMGVARWPVSVCIDPVFEGDFAPTPGWEVKGEVRNRLSISALNLAFENRCAHQGERVWRKIRAKAHVPLESLQASIVPKSAEVRIESSAASPQDYVIFVSPNPSLHVGRFRCEVRLSVVTLDNEIHPCSTLEVIGEMQTSSRVTPRLVLLGEKSIPSDAEADVTLRLPTKEWEIDHIETDTTDTSVTQFEAEGGRRLHIIQRIKQVGDQVSIIRVVVRKPDKQTEIVPVEVRYHGLKASR